MRLGKSPSVLLGALKIKSITFLVSLVAPDGSKVVAPRQLRNKGVSKPRNNTGMWTSPRNSLCAHSYSEILEAESKEYDEDDF